MYRHVIQIKVGKQRRWYEERSQRCDGAFTLCLSMNPFTTSNMFLLSKLWNWCVLGWDCFPALLENAVPVGVAGRHSKGRVALVGGVGGQVLTQRHGLLQLGGDGGRRRARQSVTWWEMRQNLTKFYQRAAQGCVCSAGSWSVLGLLVLCWVKC